MTDLIFLFFLFSFIGWLWEVGLHLVQYHEFVNRGTMYGPWLPIYGAGGVLAILLLDRFKGNLPRTVLLIMVTAGVLEFTVSWALDFFLNTSYWSYKGWFANLNGRICLAGLSAFAIGGLLRHLHRGALCAEQVVRPPPRPAVRELPAPVRALRRRPGRLPAVRPEQRGRGGRRAVTGRPGDFPTARRPCRKQQYREAAGRCQEGSAPRLCTGKPESGGAVRTPLEIPRRNSTFPVDNGRIRSILYN